jgi:hypothetical protein
MLGFSLAVLLGATAAPAQGYPEVYRGYPAQQRAYPDDPRELVRQWYRKFLDRRVDPSGYQNWVDELVRGQPPEMVLAAILASDEYYQRAGSTPEGFVQKLFQDLTGRLPTRAELDFWVRRAYTQDRVDIAHALLTRYPQTWSPEPYDPRAGSPHDYDYRRPIYRYYRR